MWTGSWTNSTIYRRDLGDTGTPNTPPDAKITLDPTNRSAGSTVTLDASESADSEGYITGYGWDFDGDGVSDAQGKRVTHVFDSAGSYTVALTVTDNNGATTTVNRSVDVVERTVTSTASQTTSSTPQSTTSEATTPRSTPQGTDSPTVTQNQQTTVVETTGEANGSNDFQRGFFSNGPEADSFAGLSNPFILTLGGFLFSAAGILLQLSRGG